MSGAIQLSNEVELEKLLFEKATLEEEMRRLEERQMELEMRARTLCEKIIEEIKKKNYLKKQTVDQLQIKVDQLEAQLEKFSVSAFLEKASVVTSENAENREAVVEEAAASKDSQEKDGPPVLIAVFDKEELGVTVNAQKESNKDSSKI